ISQLSLLTNFQSIAKGLIDARAVVYYLSMIVCFLIACAITVDMKKAD
ncbi:ABC transporter permease, partial [Candidatus Sumerlaeota bacterium]|nr:ABC transporter permease [Candidatus Sumerlaeota bacterium]